MLLTRDRRFLIIKRRLNKNVRTVRPDTQLLATDASNLLRLFSKTQLEVPILYAYSA